MELERSNINMNDRITTVMNVNENEIRVMKIKNPVIYV